MQVATQPSPVKAVFTHNDIELAAVALVQHLIASSSLHVGRPVNLSCSSQMVDEDDVEPARSSCSDAAPPPAPAPSSSAVVDTAAVANDDVAKQATTGRTQRRHRTFSIRPPVPVVGQLMEMGFARRKAEAAMKHLGMPLLLHIWLFHVLRQSFSG